MTIARIANLLSASPNEAAREQVRFLHYVENEAHEDRWEHAKDAWLDYRVTAEHIPGSEKSPESRKVR